MSPGAGGIQHDFFGRPKFCAAEMFQAIRCVPVAGTVVFDKPLFIDARAVGDEGVISNGNVINKVKIV